MADSSRARFRELKLCVDFFSVFFWGMYLLCEAHFSCDSNLMEAKSKVFVWGEGEKAVASHPCLPKTVPDTGFSCRPHEGTIENVPEVLPQIPILSSFHRANHHILCSVFVSNCLSTVEEEDSEGLGKSQTGRRTQLPAPQPDTSGLSLWNILKKNIGKDLSKIAMPVALNEPLSMLQVSHCGQLSVSMELHP